MNQSHNQDSSDDDSGHREPTPAKLPASRGWFWIALGWKMFLSRPGPWITTSLLWLFISMIANTHPLTTILLPLIYPLLMGGMMLGCQRQKASGQYPPFALFSAFEGYAGKLARLGLISVLANTVIAIVLVVFLGAFGSTEFFKALGSGDLELLVPYADSLLLVALLGMLLYLPFAMALWFAPVLVVIHDQPVLKALQLSISACMRNVFPFLIYGIWLLLAMLVFLMLTAAGPLLIVVLAPPLLSTFFASIYTSYEEIYAEQKGMMEISV